MSLTRTLAIPYEISDDVCLIEDDNADLDADLSLKC